MGHCSFVRAAESAVQERMSNLRNYMQTVSDQVKQSTDAYQLNVDGDITSLGTALAQDVSSMSAQITERLARVGQDVPDSNEGPCLH